MAKAEKISLLGSFVGFDLYKRNQGKLVRQLTALAIAVTFVLGAWTMSIRLLADAAPPVRLGVPAVLATLGCWIAFRAVNYPGFADFLIDVETEMLKVTWSSRSELYRATVVVIASMAVLSGVLFLYDFLWQALLRAAGILRF